MAPNSSHSSYKPVLKAKDKVSFISGMGELLVHSFTISMESPSIMTGRADFIVADVYRRGSSHAGQPGSEGTRRRCNLHRLSLATPVSNRSQLLKVSHAPKTAPPAENKGNEPIRNTSH